VAVASAGPYASLHLAPGRQPHQHPTTQFFTGRMPFLPHNQQCQSTEGSVNTKMQQYQKDKREKEIKIGYWKVISATGSRSF